MQELESSVRKIREAQGAKLAAEKELNALQKKAKRLHFHPNSDGLCFQVAALESENLALQQSLQSK